MVVGVVIVESRIVLFSYEAAMMCDCLYVYVL